MQEPGAAGAAEAAATGAETEVQGERPLHGWRNAAVWKMRPPKRAIPWCGISPRAALSQPGE